MYTCWQLHAGGMSYAETQMIEAIKESEIVLISYPYGRDY